MKPPPRLVARTLMAIFLTVTVILVVTFFRLSVETRQRVRAAEIDKMETTARVFTALEARRRRDQLSLVATLSETPALRAALSTYASEKAPGGISEQAAGQLRSTIASAVEGLATAARADVIAIVGNDGRQFAVAGANRDEWDINQPLTLTPDGDTFQQVIVEPGGAFRVSAARLRISNDGLNRPVGTLLVGASLDANYAQDLANLSHAGIVITVGDTIRARTVSEAAARALAQQRDTSGGILELDGEEYAVGTLLDSNNVRVFMLSSVDAATRPAEREALFSLGMIAIGSFALALIASIWLARTLTKPIDVLSAEITQMTTARDFERTIEPTRTSREIDSLANAFNELVRALSAAEAETNATYLGAVQALAAALDTRDPYTAGHSERVSAMSVLIAQHMRLPEAEVNIIRLGALLHDVGKIGVPDEILRKAGPLTDPEYEQIKWHPTLGARILRQVPFLAAHLPIVELHHERPDGLGYPYGLHADKIPVDVRIVHVADAFDAMTSARAYRPGRPVPVALAELRRHVGTQFDGAVVDALQLAMPAAAVLVEFRLQAPPGAGA